MSEILTEGLDRNYIQLLKSNPAAWKTGRPAIDRELEIAFENASDWDMRIDQACRSGETEPTGHEHTAMNCVVPAMFFEKRNSAWNEWHLKYAAAQAAVRGIGGATALCGVCGRSVFKVISADAFDHDETPSDVGVRSTGSLELACANCLRLQAARRKLVPAKGSD